MPAPDLLIAGPGDTTLLIDASVVLNRWGTVAGNHPRHDRPRLLVIASVGRRQRRQARSVDVNLMLCHTRNPSRREHPAKHCRSGGTSRVCYTE